MKKYKDYSFEEFKAFLLAKCPDREKYGEGQYDRKIYNWFDLGKPKNIKFYTRNHKIIKF